MEIETAAAWREFESARWHAAVRDRSLELRSLDADERRLVFDFITTDLERRKRGTLSPAARGVDLTFVGRPADEPDREHGQGGA